MSGNPIVSIVILNKNELKNAVQCLDAIRDSDKDRSSIQVIIVDIRSSDNSMAILRDKLRQMASEGFLDAQIIETDIDRGVPEAFERAFKRVHPGYSFLMKLDNDLFLDRHCLTELVMTGSSDDGIGLLGGKVYLCDDIGPTNKFHFIGNNFGLFEDHGKYLGSLEEDTGQFDKMMEIGAVHGAMLMVKRSVIERIGLMDTDYFMYHDDLDWCYRGRRAGFKVVFVPSAKGWHKISLNRGTVTDRFLWQATRSTLIFARKHYGRAHFLAYYAWNLLVLQRMLVLKAARSRRLKFVKSLLRGNRDGLLDHIHSPKIS